MGVNSIHSYQESYVSPNPVYTKNTEKKKETSSEKKVNASDYAADLQKKYDYYGKSVMVEGVPTSVTVSPAFLQRCVNDPEQARFLESNLNAISESVRFARYLRAGSGRVLVSKSYSVDENGNISSMSVSETANTDQIEKEQATEKREEERLEKKKLQKRMEEKELFQKLLEEFRASKEMPGEMAELMKKDSFGSNIDVYG